MEINSVHEYEGKYLKVVEGPGCVGCYFDSGDGLDDCLAPSPYDCCCSDVRKDDEFVKYIEVTEPKAGEKYVFEDTELTCVKGSTCKDCFFYNGWDECHAEGFFTLCSVNLKFIVEDKKGAAKEEYQTLYSVLQDAYVQASAGKGVERHAADNAFEDQVMCQVQRLLKDHPFGGLAYQVIKKTIEAGRLYQIKGPDAAYQETIGAINYLGGMGHLIKEKS